jgi:hypothetical protein
MKGKDVMEYNFKRSSYGGANLPPSELGLACAFFMTSIVYAKAGEVSVLNSLLHEAVHHWAVLLCSGGRVVHCASGSDRLRIR